MLISSLAACGPGAQVDEPAVAQPGEPAVAADSEDANMPDVPAMPAMLDMSGKFANMFVSEVTDTFNPRPTNWRPLPGDQGAVPG